MERRRVARWGSIGAIGGILWTIWVARLAELPIGPAGYKESGPLAPFLMGAAVTMAVGAMGLRARLGRSDADRTVVNIGSALSVGGAGLMLGGAAGVEAFGQGDLWFVPVLGIISLVLGSVLIAAAALRARVEPRWAYAALFGGLLMGGFNTEDWRAWLALPFGLAWLAMGVLLLFRPNWFRKQVAGQTR